mmetsp:Transcript_79945/g.129571  ORF Transcript_79945/g.129571 Transcript_79945/m.129571 type:complete len:91 (+) Transcript_79945:85-357(+)
MEVERERERDSGRKSGRERLSVCDKDRERKSERLITNMQTQTWIRHTDIVRTIESINSQDSATHADLPKCRNTAHTKNVVVRVSSHGGVL